MTPYEIMLSESQERMLIIAKRGREDVVREMFDKWDVPVRGDRPRHERRHHARPKQRHDCGGNSSEGTG